MHQKVIQEKTEEPDTVATFWKSVHLLHWKSFLHSISCVIEQTTDNSELKMFSKKGTS